MKKNIRKKLAKIAAELDEKKLFKLADEIDELLSEDPDEEDRRHDEMLENYIPHTPTDEAQESVALIEEHDGMFKRLIFSEADLANQDTLRRELVNSQREVPKIRKELAKESSDFMRMVLQERIENTLHDIDVLKALLK